MTDIADFIHENKLDAMRLGGQVLGAGRERHIKVFNTYTNQLLGQIPKATPTS